MDVQIVDYTRNLWQLKSKSSTHQALYFRFVDCKKDSDEPCIEERLRKCGFREKDCTVLETEASWREKGADWRSGLEASFSRTEIGICFALLQCLAKRNLSASPG